MSEINDIEEIPEGNFSISLKFIKKKQRSELSITPKYKDGTYYKGYFCEGINSDIKLITCKDKSIITLVPYVSPSFSNG